MLERTAAVSTSRERARYVEPVTPVVFPTEEESPETQLHLDLRTLLYHLLSDYLGLEATVGSEQFVYFDAADPKKVLAPDVFVRLGPRGEKIRSWKVWERGAPEVAVEIISDSDAGESPWLDKLRAYRSVGVRELVRFEPGAKSNRLRIWARVDEALVEREVVEDSAPSFLLPLQWVIAASDEATSALRIVDEQGVVVPSRMEARRMEAEARRMETAARLSAEARIRELEAEMRRLKGDR